MKRALFVVLLTACPGTVPPPDGGITDAGFSDAKDAGGTDAGQSTSVETLELNTSVREERPRYATHLTSAGTRVFGAWSDHIGFAELPFVTDGTSTGTHVLHVRPRLGSSTMHDVLLDSDGIAYFALDDGTWGHELWRSDGTLQGTRRLTDCAPGNGHTFPRYNDEARRFALLDGGVLLGCPSAPHRLDLATGTLVQLGVYENAAEFRTIAGRVYFSAEEPGGGRMPLVSDGTPLGTRRLGDVPVGHAPEFTAFGDEVFFAGGGAEQLLLAATADGGVRVAAQLATSAYRGAHAFTVGLGRLFFVGPHDTFDETFWVSDGTDAGTLPLTGAGRFFGYTNWQGLVPTPWFGRPTPVSLGGRVYFAVDGELWETNGTTAMAAPPIGGGCASISGSSMAPLNSRLLFTTLDDRLCTSAGITLTRTRFSALLGASFAPLGSRLVVGLSGEALLTDGTEAGTVPLPDPVRPASSYPFTLTPSGGELLFTASSDRVRLHAWGDSGSRTVLDGPIFAVFGTPVGPLVSTNNAALARLEEDGGTRLLISSSASIYPGVAPFGPRVLFGACGFSPPVDEVWIIDGTSIGSRLLTRVTANGCSPAGLAVDGAQGWYALTDGLRWTNGIDVEVVPLPLGLNNRVRRHTLAAGANVAWVATTEALWRVRRRAANDFEVARIFDGTLDVDNPLVWKGELYFTDSALQRTNADAGLLTLTPSYAGPTHLTPAGDDLYFSAVELDAGRELWKTRGTAATTTRVADVWPGLGTGFIGPALWLEPERVLVFTGADPAGGMELWRTDGTAAGTRRVVDLVPGPGSSEPLELARAGSWLYFSASDPDAGTELRRIPVVAATRP